MSFGPQTYQILTMTSGATLTQGVDLQRAWNDVYLVIPSLTTGVGLYLQGSESFLGTYRRIKHPIGASDPGSTVDFNIPSSCTNCLVPIPNSLRYIKIESTESVDDGCIFKIIVGGN